MGTSWKKVIVLRRGERIHIGIHHSDVSKELNAVAVKFDRDDGATTRYFSEIETDRLLAAIQNAATTIWKT